MTVTITGRERTNTPNRLSSPAARATLEFLIPAAAATIMEGSSRMLRGRTLRIVGPSRTWGMSTPPARKAPRAGAGNIGRIFSPGFVSGV